MRRQLFASLALVVCMVGCGKSGGDLVPVHGRITYGGGDWPTAGHVYFQPKQPTGNHPLRPGSAEFQPDGKFTAITGQRQGLTPGVYAVRIECWENAPTMSSPRSGKSWVADKYLKGPSDDFEVTVPEGSSGLEVNFDIPKR